MSKPSRALSNDGKFNIFAERTIDMVDVAGYYSNEALTATAPVVVTRGASAALWIRASQGNCDNVRRRYGRLHWWLRLADLRKPDDPNTARACGT
ncbi:MAG: hypothetical protein U0X75_05845 [Acidobacteriota bacterium]